MALIHTLCKDDSGNDFVIDTEDHSVVPSGYTYRDAIEWEAKIGKSLIEFTEDDWEALGIAPA